MKWHTFHRRFHQYGIVRLVNDSQRIAFPLFGTKVDLRSHSPAKTQYFSSMATADDVPSGEYRRDWMMMKNRPPSLSLYSEDVRAVHWNQQNHVQIQNESRMNIRAPPLTLSDMIEQIPFCIQQRKRLNVSPGCANEDPVLQLMRYVSLLIIIYYVGCSFDPYLCECKSHNPLSLMLMIMMMKIVF